MDLNQQTRIYYDQDETQYHRINSEKQVRWYTDDLSTNKTLQYGNSIKSIDEDNKLRAAPTRLNELYDVNTELYGTAPLKSLNDGPIDVESNLFHSYNNTDFRKPFVTESDYYAMYRNNNEHINKSIDMYHPTVVERDEILTKSTRNEYRNMRINENCY